MNLSGRSLNDEQFMEDIFALFARHQSVVHYLCLELTESGALHDLENTQRFIARVHDIGGKIALVEAIVALARSLGMRSVAEWVEDVDIRCARCRKSAWTTCKVISPRCPEVVTFVECLSEPAQAAIYDYGWRAPPARIRTASGRLHFIQDFSRRKGNARVVPLREPLNLLTREIAGMIAQRELQRIDDVIADDLRRLVVIDDSVKGFECAHVVKRRVNGPLRPYVTKNPEKYSRYGVHTHAC